MTMVRLRNSVVGLCGFGALCVVLGGPIVSASANEAERTWQLTIDTEVRAVNWTGTRGTPTVFANGAPGRGTLLHAPLSANFVWAPSPDWNFTILARTGFVKAEQSSGGGLAGTLWSATDTSLTKTFAYTGWGFFQPFVSLALNLPTGTTVLPGQRAFTRMDPDIVELATYGEGLNIGPTIGAQIAIDEATMLTLSAGHTLRGAFNRDSVFGGDGPNTRIHPAASTTLNAQIVHNIGQWSLSAGASYTISGQTTLDQIFASWSGETLALNARAALKWDDTHLTSLSASWSTTERNLIFNNATMAFVREQFNANSQTFRAVFEHEFTVTEDWMVGATGSFFLRDRNSFAITDGQFVPGKTRYSVGAFTRYRVNPSLTLSARAEYFELTENSRPDRIVPAFGVIPDTAIPKIHSRGLLGSVGATLPF